MLDISTIRPPLINFGLIAIAISAIYSFYQIVRTRVKSTKLRGPSATSFLFGVSKDTEGSNNDPSSLYEKWMDEYGAVYQIPGLLGARRTVICDPKAVKHFNSLETFGYTQAPAMKRLLEFLIGKGLLWADGESHRRQRRALTPAFTIAAVRSYTSVFFDSAYKVKAAWDIQLENSLSRDGIIEVQSWMNYVSLDSIGIAGFSHDFGCLRGLQSDIATTLDEFGVLNLSAVDFLLMLLTPIFPFLSWIPTDRKKLLDKLQLSMHNVADGLLNRYRGEKAAGTLNVSEKSIIGQLIQTENVEKGASVTSDEALAQLKVLILAGYETTSITITWALIELATHQDWQDLLREELAEFTNTDPTYEQLTNGLPQLDAIVKEVLRLHPPVMETVRVAMTDDVLPLSEPVVGPNGESIDHVVIAKGAYVAVPIRCVNTSGAVWGPDAKAFNPQRWLTPDRRSVTVDGLTSKAREFHGYHHLLSFSDGHRVCLGKFFALAEFKAVISVLIRNFKFGLREGETPNVGVHSSLLPRPKIEGEEGSRVPLRVTRIN